MRMLLLFTLACSSPSDDTSAGDGTPDGGATSDGGSSSDGGAAGQFNGTVPSVALEVPEFTTTNRDGTGRTREDVLGHPTVMWFYPTAGTSG